MKPSRWPETAAALALAAWRIFVFPDGLRRDWILPTLGIWMLWTWTSRDSRARTPLLLLAMAALFLVYVAGQLPIALDVLGLVPP